MPRSTQGRTLSYAQETALGVPGAFAEMRFDEGLEFDTTTRDAVPASNRGHAHWGDTTDMPVVYSAYKEDAITVPVAIRCAAGAGTPPIVRMLQAAGCTLNELPDTTVAGYVSTVAFERTAPPGANTYGIGQTVELNNGQYYPFVAHSALAGGLVTPMLAIPSASANANAISRTFTLTPRAARVPVDKTMAFKVRTRLLHTAGEDHTFKFLGCAGVPQPLTLAPNTVPSWPFAFHAAKREAVNETLVAETFADTQIVNAVDSNFSCGFATWDKDGGIAYACENRVTAEWDPGIRIVPIGGFGCSSLGGVEGWMVDYEPSTLTTTVVFSRARWAEFEAMPQAAFRYIHMSQPSTAGSHPAFSITMPRCKMVEAPTADFGERFVTAQIKWEASGVGIDDGTVYGVGSGNDVSSMAPWFFTINGRSA